jgi:hypothetical protein
MTDSLKTTFTIKILKSRSTSTIKIINASSNFRSMSPIKIRHTILTTASNSGLPLNKKNKNNI